MMIEGFDTSLTLFGEPAAGSQMDICRLEYKPRMMYLFNNQVPHTVINLLGTRYVFSLTFTDDKTKLNYSDIYGLV